MASKSSHHKDLNTFKFQTFNERLSNINIDVARKLNKFSVTPEDADTFFAETLQKWTDFNCTQHFVDFRREISGEVQSLAQLVHHQNEIVSALKKHLKVKESLALQPLLDLVVQLARDLQADFYPCFSEFFLILIWLLNTYHHDVEVLEQTFTCLAYLFKFLWRYLLKDVHTVFTLFCPLLGSQYKSYIHTFAAEGFAFLMRKDKNPSALFDFMFTSLQESPDMTEGVGRLLFETVRGIKQQFHSSTEKVLPVLLSKLGSSVLPHDQVHDAIVAMFMSMATHTSTQHTQCVWSVLLDAIDSTFSELERAKGKNKVLKNHQLESLLHLTHLWIEHKDGRLVSCHSRLIETLSGLLRASCLPDGCGALLCQNVSALLLADKCKLEMHHRPKLVSLIYKSELSRHLIFDFSRNVLDAPLFEKDLLPGLLDYCHSCLQLQDPAVSKQVLWTITQLLQHKLPLRKGLLPADDLPTYLLDMTTLLKCKAAGKKKESLPTWLVCQLKQTIKTETYTEGVIWAVLFCLPHVRPLAPSDCTPELVRLFEKLYSLALADGGDAPPREQTLCLLRETMDVFYRINEDKNDYFTAFSAQKILTLIKKFPDNVDVLKLADLYLTSCGASAVVAEEEVLTEDLFNELYGALQENLSSPYAQVRLLTLHILCQFELQMPSLPENMELKQIGVFKICLEAEQTPVSVHMYREKLRHLQKLSHDIVQYQLPVGPFQHVALRYLIGTLYVNLSLLWEPVIKLIASHADGLPREEFWAIYSRHLDHAATLTESDLKRRDTADSETGHCLDDLESIWKLYIRQTSHETDRPDHSNFRHFLWKAMHSFPDVCEPKSKILSPLLFRFLENEYFPSDYNMAPSQDIRRKENDEDTEEDHGLDQSQPLSDDDLDNSQSENFSQDKSFNADQPEQTEDKSKNRDKRRSGGKSYLKKHKPKRATNKSFVVHLALFSKFKNPKVLYMEPRLRELYMQLLQHVDLRIQQVAFECVMTYSYKYLVPYRENFERLMDDKTFKNEVILFSIDEETTIVKADHRNDLLPILLRILYGKMQTKTGKDSSGRANSQFRKSVVLRFLAGSRGDEIKIFLDLVFEPFKSFMEGDILQQVHDSMKHTDPSNIIPLKKLQGVLNTVDLVLRKLGSKLESYLPNIIQIVACIGALTSSLLSDRTMISPKAVNMVKTIRNMAVNRINWLFSNFDFYKFRPDEVEAIFDFAVWPQLSRLPNESLYSPTPLLKLFDTWSQNIRYFPLLARVQASDSGLIPLHASDSRMTPLPFVFPLLHASHVKPAVVTVVMDMVERLLMTEDPDDEDSETEELRPHLEKGGLPYGTRLLLPHVNTILLHLKSVVAKLSGAGGKKKLVPARELNILSRLSEHVRDSEQSAEIIALLIPFLGRRIQRSQDVEVDVLMSINHLIQLVERPERFLQPLAKIFSILSVRASRTALCQVLQTIGKKSEEVAVIADVITKMNAWDRRRVEEPDYLLRLQGFDEARELLKQPPDVSLMLLLVHNCCFFLANVDDMSLRDSSGFCLQKLVEKIAENFETNSEMFNLIVRQNLLPEVQDKLKHLNEVVRNENITLLACLVQRFPTCSDFSNLLMLVDKEDVEVDFFSNITHIQHHRRARALRRLARILSSKSMHSMTLVSYLLPITSMFIKDPAYAKASNLHDAAVDAFGAICRQLPWSRYQVVLRYYIGQLPKSLENQKLAVRLVVAILDAFHFDLKQSRGVHAVHLAEADETTITTTEEQTDAVLNDQPSVTEASEPDDGEGTDKEATDDHDDRGDDHDEPGDEDKESGDSGTADFNPNQCHQCGPGLATKIHKLIVRTIVPQLHKSLTQKSKSDSEHKKAQPGKYAEDEEILRVPLALAMVKLLQRLPKGSLEQNLPGVLLKVCQFLRSRARDIRESARDTLNKILTSLGPRYLFFILKELRSALRRGYQLHVLCYTVWSLLRNLTTSDLKPGELDGCIDILVVVMNEELFGAVAEEKEVEGIVGKLFEAKSSKSYDSYGIIAKYVSKSSLTKVVSPLKEVLEGTSSHKKARKVCDVLHKVCLGLVENSGLDQETLLSFVYAITHETLPQLTVKKKERSKEEESVGFRPRSSFLLTKEPPRGGTKAKQLKFTNMYIVVDFGLQILHLLLKKSMLSPGEKTHLQMLDPFVETLTSCLASKHTKVITTALRCLSWMIKFPLPSLKHHIPTVTNHLFVLLSNYATAGAAQGDNFDLAVICFKTMTVVLRDVHYHTITPEQLQVLLQYVEQDIHDFSRQATAFTLLRAILSRKLVVPEMQDVMKKIEQLSVVSEMPHVRLQCRQVVMQYLLDYPLGKKLFRHIEFYVKQLEYEYEAGRESALEMLAKIFSDFPEAILTKQAGFFFLPLTTRLVNDQSPRCKKLTALAIKSLMNRLASVERDKLFTMCMEWLKQPSPSVCKLATLACGLFVEVESSGFERHLETLLPRIEELLQPEKYPEEHYNKSEERDSDHLLYMVLNLFLKLCRECNLLTNPVWNQQLNPILEHVQNHMLYPHTWVRLCASQLFGLLFGSWKPEELIEAHKNDEDLEKSTTRRRDHRTESVPQTYRDHRTESVPQTYILQDFQAKLHGLCGVFCKQLASPQLEQELADQVVKNLVFLARILKHLPDDVTDDVRTESHDASTGSDNVTKSTGSDDVTKSTGSDDVTKRASLRWLIRRMCREARMESSLNPKLTIKRSCVFKWIAAVSLDLGADRLLLYLPVLLQPVVREVTSANAEESLKQLGQEVLDLMKTTVGVDRFTKEYASVQTSLADKREGRKRQRAMDAVANPELSAKRKMKKNLLKAEARKRRVTEMRPTRNTKKAKLSHMAIIDS